MNKIIEEIKDSNGKVVRRKVRTYFDGESKTEQHHKQQCNINTIMQKAYKTGLVPQRRGALCGDFTNRVDYQTACNKIADAKQDFAELPSNLRRRFHNDPGEFIDFLADEKNLDEAVKLGILSVVEPETPDIPPVDTTPNNAI